VHLEPGPDQVEERDDWGPGAGVCAGTVNVRDNAQRLGLLVAMCGRYSVPISCDGSGLRQVYSTLKKGFDHFHWVFDVTDVYSTQIRPRQARARCKAGVKRLEQGTAHVKNRRRAAVKLQNCRWPASALSVNGEVGTTLLYTCSMNCKKLGRV